MTGDEDEEKNFLARLGLLGCRLQDFQLTIYVRSRISENKKNYTKNPKKLYADT